MIALNLALFWLGVAAAVVLPVRYWIGSRRWFRAPLAWVLMSLAAVVLLLYSKGVVVLLSGGAIATTSSAIFTNGLVAAWLIGTDIVIDYVIRKHSAEMDHQAAQEQEHQS